MNMRLKVIAHKASVYCIAFDRTGTYALSVRLEEEERKGEREEGMF